MGRKIYCIGIGMGAEDTLTRRAEEYAASCDVLVGAGRMTERFRNLGKPCYEEYRPEKIRAFLEEHSEYQTCAALFSGDTGFYSGAGKLARVMEGSGMEVEFLPGISSVCYLAAKLKISWEDAGILSLHGRRQNFIGAVSRNRKTFLILGRDEGKEICEKLEKYQLHDVTVHIGKRLSYEDESIISRKGSELRPEDLNGLVTILIENPDPIRRVGVHLADEELIRGKVPMTKAEVRAVSIAKLELTEDAVLYDVGAGTGSVSVEAALQSEQIRVYAVEKNPEGADLIRQNCRKFRCDWIEVIEGIAPEALEDLESPTHVFIGGSSGNLKEILSLVKRKNPKVRIVINAITLETLREVMEAAEKGLLEDPEITQMTVAKARKLGDYHMMTGQNPIYIIADGGER